jgi:hypothetical protein
MEIWYPEDRRFFGLKFAWLLRVEALKKRVLVSIIGIELSSIMLNSCRAYIVLKRNRNLRFRISYELQVGNSNSQATIARASESEGFLSMKIDSSSFGVDIAALVQTVCIGFHLRTLVYSCTEDT